MRTHSFLMFHFCQKRPLGDDGVVNMFDLKHSGIVALMQQPSLKPIFCLFSKNESVKYNLSDIEKCAEHHLEHKYCVL